MARSVLAVVVSYIAMFVLLLFTPGFSQVVRAAALPLETV